MDNRPVGVVSDLDVVAAVAVGADCSAHEAAATEPLTVSADEPLRNAAQMMSEHGVSHLLVVDGAGGYPVGVALDARHRHRLRGQLSQRATRSMSAIAAAARYPLEREADVVLRDGATVHVRPVRADDGPAMRAFFESVSPDSIWFRFFGTVNLDWATSWSVNVDYADRFGLVVESGNPRAIIAHAAYVRIDHERAEVAFLVADAWQGAGYLDDPARPSRGGGRAARNLDVRSRRCCRTTTG